MNKSGENKNPFMQSRLDEMVEKISKATGVQPQEPGAEPKLGRWAHLGGAQFSSTESNLARQAEGKFRDWDLPLNPDAQVPEKIREENVREVSPDEFVMIDGMRKRGHGNTIGQSEKPATTPERRDSAIHHFEVSGHVTADQITPNQAITGLKPIESESPVEVVEKKLTAWQAFRVWLAGGKVWESKND